MYGTIGRLHIKQGMGSQFSALLQGQARAFETGQEAGFVASYTYGMDADPNDYFIAVVFEMAKSTSSMRREELDCHPERRSLQTAT
jgi:hypothetical protein